MTREEQLVFCKKCLNRKMDVQQGLICKLTGQKADFESDCGDFDPDESVKEVPVDNEEGLQPAEIMEQLSPDIFEKLKMEQNLMAGIVSGVIVGLLGAVLWGAITVATGYQIGFMAIAIGAAVGFTVRKFGNGVEKIFGIWGAAISFFSVVFGNFLSIIGYLAEMEGLGYLETILLFDYSFFPQLMIETAGFIDIIFYGLAIIEGYKFSFRLITDQNIQEIKAENR